MDGENESRDKRRLFSSLSIYKWMELLTSLPPKPPHYVNDPLHFRIPSTRSGLLTEGTKVKMLYTGFVTDGNALQSGVQVSFSSSIVTCTYNPASRQVIKYQVASTRSQDYSKATCWLSKLPQNRRPGVQRVQVVHISSTSIRDNHSPVVKVGSATNV